MELIGAAEAALRANLSREVVVRLIQCGRLRGARQGRFWLVEDTDLDRFLGERRTDANGNGGMSGVQATQIRAAEPTNRGPR
jgi:excisionase family DNA binding protein